MPQYQGVWSLQSAAQLQSTQRWVTDPLFENTTLLLQADPDAPATQNNTFLDSSNSNYPITRNGNTTQGSFTPFSTSPGTWSTYFPGASSLVVPAGSAFAYGTGNFTVEAWISPYTYQAGLSTGGQIISQTTSGQNYFTFQIGGSGELVFTFGSGGGTAISTSSGSIPLGIWTHVAVVREGTGANQLKLYVNGFLLQSGTCSFNFTDTTYNPTVGNYTHNSTQLPFGGYINNLRVVKGVAVYTGNFTPSLLPLTATQSAGINIAAITGTQTSLLTAQSNRFLDNSVANAGGGWTVTLGGTPSVQPFSPFAPQFQWTPSVIGGSGYFDGSADNLVSASLGTSIGTGDYCLEAWVYTTNAASSFVASVVLNNSSGYIIYLQISGNTVRFLDFQNPGTNFVISGGTINSNEWVHIVGTRQSGNMRAFVNGRLAAYQSTVNFNYGTAGTVEVPPSVAQYVSGVRVNIGSVPTSYQTSSTTTGTQIFTPPTAPATTTSQGATAGNVRLLLNMTNAAIYDGAMKNNLETVGNAQVSAAVVKYGSGSMFFDGTGDLLFSPANQNYSFTGDFTIECWVNTSTISLEGGSYRRIFATGPDAVTSLQLVFSDSVTTSGNVSLVTNTFVITGNINAATGAWVHVALARAGSSMRLFVNGVQSGSTLTTTQAFTGGASNGLFVGSASGGTGRYLGYIDDFRITQGVARYTQNFIPPSVALPRQ